MSVLTVDDVVPVDPSLFSEAHIIKEYKVIDCMYKLEVGNVREEIWLHYSYPQLIVPPPCL